MAETTPTPANISALAPLEEALARPEPMCLAIIQVHRPGAADAESAQRHVGRPEDAIIDEAECRLRDTLRDYDELTVIDSTRFALVLRTLADATVLNGRLHTLYAIMSRPYTVAGEEIHVEVYLGAAVRSPQETARQLVDRVDQAVVLARSSTIDGPVML